MFKTGPGTLVIGEVGEPPHELMERAWDAHMLFWYWLALTEDEWEVFV